MAGSIDGFKGLIGSKRGPARTNLFQVVLPSFDGATASNLNMLCRDIVLPGRQLATYDKEVGTKREKVVYGEVHDDVAMTFLVLNDYGVKKYFESWQKLAYDIENYQIGYKANYVRQVQISQLNKGTAFPLYNKYFNFGNFGPVNLGIDLDIDLRGRDTVIYTCTLEDAWPVSIDQIQLNNELDGLIELRVQLAYTKWKSAYTI